MGFCDEQCAAGGQLGRGRLRAEAAVGAAAADPWRRLSFAGGKEGEQSRSIRSMGARRVRDRLCSDAFAGDIADRSWESCRFKFGGWLLLVFLGFCVGALADNCWKDFEPKGVNERWEKAKGVSRGMDGLDGGRLARCQKPGEGKWVEGGCE
jgi:hypothetical protein